MAMLTTLIIAYKNRPTHILQDPSARRFWATFPDQPQITPAEAETLRRAMEQHNAMQLFTFLDYYRAYQQNGQKLYGGWDARTVETIGALLDRINGQNWQSP